LKAAGHVRCVCSVNWALVVAISHERDLRIPLKMMQRGCAYRQVQHSPLRRLPHSYLCLRRQQLFTGLLTLDAQRNRKSTEGVVVRVVDREARQTFAELLDSLLCTGLGGNAGSVCCRRTRMAHSVYFSRRFLLLVKIRIDVHAAVDDFVRCRTMPWMRSPSGRDVCGHANGKEDVS